MKLSRKIVTRAVVAGIALLYLGLRTIPHPLHAAELRLAEADIPVTVAGEALAGALSLSGAFARATLPNAPVGGGFLTIVNHGTEPDRLIGAASPIAGKVEVHEMSMKGDVMEMRALSDGLDIPPGSSVTLAPGGKHLMFMQLKAPLVEGETIPVTLVFEKAGPVEIAFGVVGINGKAPGADIPSP